MHVLLVAPGEVTVAPSATGGIDFRSTDSTGRALGGIPLALSVNASAIEAEAICLRRGMQLARERNRATELLARCDGLPVVNAVNGKGHARDPRRLREIERLREGIRHLERFDLRWAPASHRLSRGGVPTADALARQAAGLDRR